MSSQRQRKPHRTELGEVDGLTVASGASVLVKGAAWRVSVEPGDLLTAQRAGMDIELRGEGSGLILQGATAGELKVGPGATALVQGALADHIRNFGRMIQDGANQRVVENLGNGEEIGRGLVADLIRNPVGTVKVNPS